MRLDPKKTYLVTDGDLLDDGTVNVHSVDGKCILKAKDVENILKMEPRPGDCPLHIFERVATFTADCKWTQRA